MTTDMSQAILEGIQAIDGRLDKMDARLDRMDGRLDRMDTRFDTTDRRLQNLETGFAVVVTELRALDAGLSDLRRDVRSATDIRLLMANTQVMMTSMNAIRDEQLYQRIRLEEIHALMPSEPEITHLRREVPSFRETDLDREARIRRLEDLANSRRQPTP